MEEGLRRRVAVGSDGEGEESGGGGGGGGGGGEGGGERKRKRVREEVWRRYSEFDALRNFLCSIYPHVRTVYVIYKKLTLLEIYFYGGGGGFRRFGQGRENLAISFFQ